MNNEIPQQALSVRQRATLNQLIANNWQTLGQSVLHYVKGGLNEIALSLRTQYKEIDQWAKQRDFSGLVGNRAKRGKFISQQPDDRINELAIFFDYVSQFTDEPKAAQKQYVSTAITQLFGKLTRLHDAIIVTFGIKKWLPEKIGTDVIESKEGATVYTDLLAVFHAVPNWG